MRNPFARRKLTQIGPAASIDVKLITAMYLKAGVLTIRFGGIGIIELHSYELFDSANETFDKLQKMAG